MNILSNRVTIDRDPTNKNLEAALFQKLAEIVKPTAPEVPQSNIRSVGVEEALKELMELEKNKPGE